MLIFIECMISPGAFSGELAFRIENGIQHVGLASRRYFYTSEGEPVGMKQISDNVSGYIQGRILEEEEGRLLVSIPDNEVVWVKADKVKPCEPTHVPFRPRPALGH